MKIRARCADGPYAGQTFEIAVPHEQIHYAPRVGAWEIGPLMWVYHGADRHAYSLIQHRAEGGWRGWHLVFRDTF